MAMDAAAAGAEPIRKRRETSRGSLRLLLCRALELDVVDGEVVVAAEGFARDGELWLLVAGGHRQVWTLSPNHAKSSTDDQSWKVRKNLSALPLKLGWRTFPLTGVTPRRFSRRARNHFLNCAPWSQTRNLGLPQAAIVLRTRASIMIEVGVLA
jgi:hypothetical protein